MRARAAAGRPAPPAKPAKRRQPPLRLRRSDLPLGTPQPWAVDLAPARLVDVALPSLLARLADEEGGGGSAAPSYVSLCLSVKFCCTYAYLIIFSKFGHFLPCFLFKVGVWVGWGGAREPLQNHLQTISDCSQTNPKSPNQSLSLPN